MAVPLQIEGLCKSFGTTVAVDEVTLAIEPGELFFLLGPSGCGKTTLLRCIAGFCEPDKGTIRLGEKDITHVPPHERDTGMVFQSYALWPHMTVTENIAFGLEMKKTPGRERKQRVTEALELVQMTDRANHKPSQLSGGQQQRVALARALVIRPKCLLLDEPLSNLDAKLRLEMRTEIRRICKQAGLTAVYVTHDQKEALSIADRIAVLDKGQVQQCGEPRDVYLRPCSRFVANFIGETNFIEGTVSKAQPGSLLVRTPIGEIECKASAAAATQAGRQVVLSLRPEIIHVGAPPAYSRNVFDGKIHDTIYLGELAQHSAAIRASDETTVELRIFETNPKFIARDDRTHAAKIWFNPEDVVVLMK